MKWQLLSLVTVAAVIWGCDALEETAGVHTSSGEAVAGMTYRIGLNMTNDKQVKLAIHRDVSGKPVCIVVGGFDNEHQVPLQLSGTGMWKLNSVVADNAAQGTYDRYRPKDRQQFDLVLHWTKKRGSISEKNSTAEGRLEYFMVNWHNNSYEYQSDIDQKSNLVSGSPFALQNNFGASCNS